MHTTARIAFRYLAGRPLDGQPRTDATFLHRGTRPLTITGRASRWAMLPGWQRAAYRIAVPTITAAVGTAAALAPEATAAAGTVTGATAGTLAGRRAWRAYRQRRHTRDWVSPLAAVLAPMLWPAGAPRGWLHVPLDVHDEGEVRIQLPGYLGADQRRTIVEICEFKLGLHTDYTTRWNYAGRDQHLALKRLPLPPDRVGLDDALDAMLTAPESRPVLGLGRRSKVVAVDLDAESPHILISAGSGGGKSVQTRAIVAQLMRHGAQATFLDVKRQSHRWARDLPGVTYCRDTPDIHQQLIDLADEGERRNRLADEIADDVDTTKLDVGPRIVVVCEEMNATIHRLQAYWAEIRGPKDPKTSPAVKALGEILFMGRAVKMHVIAIAQLMTARSLGGPEARENFATRILARYTVNAWRMLVPEIWPAPKATRHVGRVQVVIGGEAHETQVLFLTDKQAREWAAGGTVTVPATWDTGRDLRDRGGVTAEPRFNLAEAARQEWCPVTYSALRKRAERGRRGGTWPAGTMIDGVEKWTQEQILAALRQEATA